ncbi:4-hydroxybenzoyl-CoA reductase subunit beta [Georgfuchsia toluolica]|uniref:4-hydroxybenzoyl-CoA reductase subunit beta n=1 Tax=Georgfuchsia toluolica TaxID=424218 RepID=A0A916J3D9_9PROT|nr:4-hydroxybenzoyl-CoA reductase subunit beta [Georgfuchsia toluolica]CAG4883248.1 4-hydroxybenzoyl-CoA reductase subunit beta [Georgfuchsia toluolica]
MDSIPAFRLQRPDSAAAAVALRAENPASRFIAGGTDLLPNIRRGLTTPEMLIDLGGISELRKFREEAGTLCIGAGVTLSTIAANAHVQTHLPALAHAAGAVAGPTHRMAATLGGNLCLDTRCQYYNQSESWRKGLEFCLKRGGDVCRVAPKSSRCYAAFSGDVAPALLALNATIEILSPQGSRRLPIREFYRDDGKTYISLAADEMLLGVEVPLVDGWKSAYDKVRVRGAIDFPLVGVAIALRRDGDTVGDLRIACTGVSSRPELIDGLESVYGKPLDDASLALIDKRIRHYTRPVGTTIIDVSYRRQVMPVLARRLLRRLGENC